MSRKKYKCGAKVLDIYIINYCIYTQYLHIKLLHRYVYNTLHIICIETMSLNPCLVSSGRYSAGCTGYSRGGVPAAAQCALSTVPATTAWHWLPCSCVTPHTRVSPCTSLDTGHGVSVDRGLWVTGQWISTLVLSISGLWMALLCS